MLEAHTLSLGLSTMSRFKGSPYVRRELISPRPLIAAQCKEHSFAQIHRSSRVLKAAPASENGPNVPVLRSEPQVVVFVDLCPYGSFPRRTASKQNSKTCRQMLLVSSQDYGPFLGRL